MSVDVQTEVWRHSQADLGARLVLLALADAASDDGVVWLGQETLARKAHIVEQSVRRVLRELEVAGELETRKAQRGRRRINVYRVTVGRVTERDVDYDRLPFEVDRPFTTAHIARSSEADDRASSQLTTAHPASKRVPTPSSEPSEDPTGPPHRPPTLSRVTRLGAVDRVPVSDEELEKANAILERWNEQASQDLRSLDWLRKIVMRLRERPELGVEEHDRIIASALQPGNRWWKGDPSPSVVYGNGALFERCLMQAASSATPASQQAFEIALAAIEDARRAS